MNTAESTSTTSSPKNRGQGWPVPAMSARFTPGEQNRLEIHFGVITPEPVDAAKGKAKAKSKKNTRKR